MATTPAARKTAAQQTGPQDARPAAKKSAARKTAVKKAAAAEAAGGGPEDPLADAAAASALMPKKDSSHKTEVKAGKGFSRANPARWVLIEFLVCFVILGLGTIVAPEGEKNSGASHLAVKGSALALLFFILGLMSGGGAKAQKAAGALGGLVTAAYVFTSQDAANLVKWINSFFGSPSSSAAGAAGGAGAGAGAGAAAAAGAVAAGGLAGAAQ